MAGLEGPAETPEGELMLAKLITGMLLRLVNRGVEGLPYDEFIAYVARDGVPLQVAKETVNLLVSRHLALVVTGPRVTMTAETKRFYGLFYAREKEIEAEIERAQRGV